MVRVSSTLYASTALIVSPLRQNHLDRQERLSPDIEGTGIREASMAEQHKPGEKVQTSGIYKVVKDGYGASFEVTCVCGASVFLDTDLG